MISVIVPTLNEAENLGHLLARLAGEETVHEVIVADGGSGDGSGAIAGEKGLGFSGSRGSF